MARALRSTAWNHTQITVGHVAWAERPSFFVHILRWIQPNAAKLQPHRHAQIAQGVSVNHVRVLLYPKMATVCFTCTCAPTRCLSWPD